VSLLRKHLLDPAARLLTQGVSPESISAAVASGAVISVCPFIGVPTPLCAFVAWRWQLNMVIVQGINFLCAGLQWLLLLPFLRGGEILFGAPRFPLSVAELKSKLALDFWGTAVWFWKSAVYGLVLWALLALPVIWLVYRGCLPMFRRMAERRAARS
jgi:uncharacterized protein (DUF2062 family)